MIWKLLKAQRMALSLTWSNDAKDGIRKRNRKWIWAEESVFVEIGGMVLFS